MTELDESWEGRRRRLENELVQAALAVFDHIGSHAFCLPVPDSRLFIAVGEAQAISALLPQHLRDRSQ